MDDKTLVEEARRGDADAFGELVRRHDSLVRRLVRRYAAIRDEDDLTQRALMTAYRKLERLEDASRFESWLWGITMRVCWSWAASERKQAGRGSALEDLPEPPSYVEAISTAERAELRDHIAAAIAELPENYQTPIILRYLDGLSYDEIAKATDKTLGQTRARIYRGTKRLRERLRSIWEELYQEPPRETLPGEIVEILKHHPGSVMVLSDELDVMAVNEHYSRRTGYDASSAIGHKCYELNHNRSKPCDGADHPCPLSMIGTSTKQVRVLHRHRNADGKYEDVEVFVFPVDQQTRTGRRRYFVECISPRQKG